MFGYPHQLADIFPDKSPVRGQLPPSSQFCSCSLSNEPKVLTADSLGRPFFLLCFSVFHVAG